MSQHADLLPRYKQLRQIGLGLNNRLVTTLSREDIHDGARKLGIFHNNTIVLDSEDQTSVLMDFCLHDVRRGGRNALDRFLTKSPPPADSDEMLLLKAKQNAWYSLFQILQVERGVGVECLDLLRDEALFIVDVGLSQTGDRGTILASRMMVAHGITMTTGAPLPAAGFSRGDWKRMLIVVASTLRGADRRHLPPAVSSALAARIIRACLKQGAAEYTQYRDPGEGIPDRPASSALAPARRAGRNDRCPCGSGRKFKNCCGSMAANRI